MHTPLRLFAALAVFLLVSSCATHTPPASPVLPPTASQIVLKSLIRTTVENPFEGTYVCSGFSVGTYIYLTAAHCTVHFHETMHVNNFPVDVLKVDEDVDLALLRIWGMNKPPLYMRVIPLAIGEQVKAAGFAGGLLEPLVSEHTVKYLNNTSIFRDTYPGTILQHGFIGGMSGGPIFDNEGLVVGVIQRGNEEHGYGVTSETILKFLNWDGSVQ